MGKPDLVKHINVLDQVDYRLWSNPEEYLMRHRKQIKFGLMLSVLVLVGCTILPTQTTQLPTGPSPREEMQITATKEPMVLTSTATLFASSTPTPTQKVLYEGERLAYLEGSQLVIVHLKSGSTIRVGDKYRQLQGWSPSGDYLLSVREDGEIVVVGVDGEIVTTIKDLSQPGFWAAPNELESAEDWLALPKQDGAFELLSLPSLQTQSVLDPGSLGADGMADVRWGANGEWIVTPSLAQLQNQVSFESGLFAPLLNNGPSVQFLAVGGMGGLASRDFHQAYFQVLDGVPGSGPTPGNLPDTILLGFQVPNECSSCQADGLELVSLNTWSERILPQGLSLLNTQEAYAWNPAQPGLLALAEGGSRFTFEHKRLALLDVRAGQSPRYLTGEEQVVFEPSWSPDGRRLAYATLPAVGQPVDSSQDQETLLGGRAIAIYDVQSGETNRLTSPGRDEIDGWPRWSADGKSLIYARKRLADLTTEIHRVEIGSSADTLLLSIADTPQACHRYGCSWEQMLAYSTGQTAPAQVAVGPVLAPTPTPSIQMDTPQAGWNTYSDPGYGFSFQYPADWKISGFPQLPNYLGVGKEDTILTIGYRRPNQQANIQRTGVGSGDFVASGSVQFLGKTLQRHLLVYGGKVKAVFYHSAAEFDAGGLIFTLSVDDVGNGRYEDVDIPQDVQEIMDRIIQSFHVDK